MSALTRARNLRSGSQCSRAHAADCASLTISSALQRTDYPRLGSIGTRVYINDSATAPVLSRVVTVDCTLFFAGLTSIPRHRFFFGLVGTPDAAHPARPSPAIDCRFSPAHCSLGSEPLPAPAAGIFFFSLSRPFARPLVSRHAPAASRHWDLSRSNSGRRHKHRPIGNDSTAAMHTDALPLYRQCQLFRGALYRTLLRHRPAISKMRAGNWYSSQLP